MVVFIKKLAVSVLFTIAILISADAFAMGSHANGEQKTVLEKQDVTDLAVREFNQYFFSRMISMLSNEARNQGIENNDDIDKLHLPAPDYIVFRDFSRERFLEFGMIKPESQLVVTLGNRGDFNILEVPAVIITNMPEKACIALNRLLNLRKIYKEKPRDEIEFSTDDIPTLNVNPDLTPYGEPFPNHVSPVIPLSRGCFRAPDNKLYYIQYASNMLRFVNKEKVP